MVREYKYVYVDLQWSVDETHMVTQAGDSVSANELTFSGDNPEKGLDKCIGFGYQEILEYFDFMCDNTDDSAESEVLCWKEL